MIDDEGENIIAICLQREISSPWNLCLHYAWNEIFARINVHKINCLDKQVLHTLDAVMQNRSFAIRPSSKFLHTQESIHIHIICIYVYQRCVQWSALQPVRACANSHRGKYLHRITWILIIGVAGLSFFLPLSSSFFLCLSLSETTVVQVRKEKRRESRKLR